MTHQFSAWYRGPDSGTRPPIEQRILIALRKGFAFVRELMEMLKSSRSPIVAALDRLLASGSVVRVLDHGEGRGRPSYRYRLAEAT